MARMLVKDESDHRYYMRVCALAYNGVPLPEPCKEGSNNE